VHQKLCLTVKRNSSGDLGSDGVADSKCVDISSRRLTKHAAVFAIELAHTFVADFVRRAVASIPSMSIRSLALCSLSCF
jgi:hypothetical protein